MAITNGFFYHLHIYTIKPALRGWDKEKMVFLDRWSN